MKKHNSTNRDRLIADNERFKLKCNTHTDIKLTAAQFLWHWNDLQPRDLYELKASNQMNYWSQLLLLLDAKDRQFDIL